MQTKEQANDQNTKFQLISQQPSYILTQTYVMGLNFAYSHRTLYEHFSAQLSITLFRTITTATNTHTDIALTTTT